MTSASNHEDHTERVLRGPGARRASLIRRRPPSIRWAPMAAVIGFAVLAAGCGGSHGQAIGGSGSSASNRTSASSTSSGPLLAYARCMRSHGIPDFPDPTAGPGGSGAIALHDGPEGDLNPDNPAFQAADEVCRVLLHGGEQAATPSAQKLNAEVTWAACMRSHGVPGFPDPNSQGAFDSSKFDDSSPEFQTATKACMKLQPGGAITAVPGRP